LATATKVHLCPYCEDALPVDRPSHCPHCGRALGQEKTRSAAFFECPDYLWFQKTAFNTLPDKKPKETLAKDRDKILLEIDKDLTLFVRTADPETLHAALFDAHLILSHVLHSKVNGETLKKIIMTAKAIGKLGDTIDQYIKSGGAIQDGRPEVEPVLPARHSDIWSATATADGGDLR
jgi:hypothetical protein